MTHADEWGPWIEHDGKGCPVPIGTLGELVGQSHPLSIYAAGESAVCGDLSTAGQAWDWSNYGKPSLAGNGAIGKILRYRVRKPRGMAVLNTIMADLDAPIVEVAQ